ncbi:hypothetical protein M3Y99_01993500 [Aphelenchoides fujianensis]|nr:hypothetical protein M3Y99_01993500 [Aphelenchoides fujianensis]
MLEKSRRPAESSSTNGDVPWVEFGPAAAPSADLRRLPDAVPAAAVRSTASWTAASVRRPDGREGPPPPSAPKPPQATALLFVGNITERCPDVLMRQMLELCGPIENWKRIQGADGRFPPFGFCGFLHPSSAVLAIRVLDGFLLGEKKLNVKADENVKRGLVDFCPFGHELEPDEGDLKEIAELRTKLQNLIALEQPSLLSEAKGKEPEKNRNVEPKPPKPEDRSGQRVAEEAFSAFKTGNRVVRPANDPERPTEVRVPDRDRTPRSSRSRSSSSSRSDRSRSNSTFTSPHSRSHSFSNGRTSTVSVDRPPAKAEESDSDEAEERKERKREQRRKDEEYLRQLKKYEEREKRMAKQYAREEEAEQTRKKAVQREAKKLLQFLEDYNDKVDDEKYYKHSWFVQRKKEYAEEREADSRDRQAEAKEIAEAKAELMRDQNGKSSRKRRERHTVVGESPMKGPDWTPLSDQPSTSTRGDPKGQQPKVITTVQARVLTQASGGVFGEEETEEEVHDRIESMTADERKQMVKELIDAIPTNKAELFKYEIGWEHLDETLITQRIKPWVEKKIREYIGDEEPSLVSFICERVQARSEPTRLLGDLAMASPILDEEADSFMTKLWRLIAFQTEAKKVGLNVNKP